VRAEDTGKDFVDAAKLAIQIEDVVERLGIEVLRDSRILGDAVAETGIGFPSGHSVFLDGFVGLIAGHTLFDEILKKLAGENEALSGVEVAEHAFGENTHFADDGGHFGEHVIDEDGGVWEDDALDRRVGDVAFVPESDIFVGGEHVAANEAGEAANLFTGDGIAFVGHGGAAALVAAERLFGFANFGALEMADFEGDLFESGGNEGKGAEIVGVAVAGDDLRGDAGDRQTEPLADLFFDFRAEMGSVADRARDFAEGDFTGSLAEAVDVALIFREPVGNFQAEGDGLGMDAMGAANLRSALEFVGTHVEDFAEENEVAFDDAGGVAEEERLSGVDDVVGSHAVMEPARGGRVADGFADGHGEGDDVVFDLGFDFENAVDVDFGAGTKNRGSFGGNLAGFGQCVGGSKFNIEPALEAIGVAPDAAHFFTGIAWNHVALPLRYGPLSHVATNAGWSRNRHRGNPAA